MTMGVHFVGDQVENAPGWVALVEDLPFASGSIVSLPTAGVT